MFSTNYKNSVDFYAQEFELCSETIQINDNKEVILIDDQNDDEEQEIIEVEDLTIVNQEPSVNRFKQEFIELDKIGSGSFGCVLEVRSQKDGCLYAIKKDPIERLLKCAR